MFHRPMLEQAHKDGIDVLCCSESHPNNLGHVFTPFTMSQHASFREWTCFDFNASRKDTPPDTGVASSSHGVLLLVRSRSSDRSLTLHSAVPVATPAADWGHAVCVRLVYHSRQRQQRVQPRGRRRRWKVVTCTHTAVLAVAYLPPTNSNHLCSNDGIQNTDLNADTTQCATRPACGRIHYVNTLNTLLTSVTAETTRSTTPTKVPVVALVIGDFNVHLGGRTMASCIRRDQQRRQLVKDLLTSAQYSVVNGMSAAHRSPRPLHTLAPTRFPQGGQVGQASTLDYALCPPSSLPYMLSCDVSTNAIANSISDHVALDTVLLLPSAKTPYTPSPGARRDEVHVVVKPEMVFTVPSKNDPAWKVYTANLAQRLKDVNFMLDMAVTASSSPPHTSPPHTSPPHTSPHTSPHPRTSPSSPPPLTQPAAPPPPPPSAPHPFPNSSLLHDNHLPTHATPTTHDAVSALHNAMTAALTDAGLARMSRLSHRARGTEDTLEHEVALAAAAWSSARRSLARWRRGHVGQPDCQRRLHTLNSATVRHALAKRRLRAAQRRQRASARPRLDSELRNASDPARAAAHYSAVIGNTTSRRSHGRTATRPTALSNAGTLTNAVREWTAAMQAQERQRQRDQRPARSLQQAADDLLATHLQHAQHGAWDDTTSALNGDFTTNEVAAAIQAGRRHSSVVGVPTAAFQHAVVDSQTAPLFTAFITRYFNHLLSGRQSVLDSPLMTTMLVPLYKGKGDPATKKAWRDLTLRPCLATVLFRVLACRLRDHLERCADAARCARVRPLMASHPPVPAPAPAPASPPPPPSAGAPAFAPPLPTGGDAAAPGDAPQQTLDDAQCGFRPNCSINDLKLLHELTIRNTYAKKRYCATLYVDIKGAFPSTPPEVVGVALHRHGVQGRLWYLLWLAMGVTQLRVRFGDKEAQRPVAVSCGLREGSPLSPVLFNVAHSHLHARVAAAIDNTNSAVTWPTLTAGPWTYDGPTAAPIVSYADDDKVAVTAASAEELHGVAQAACTAVEDFMNSCSYSVNLAPDGTKTVLYLTAPSNVEDDDVDPFAGFPDVYIQGQRVPVVTDTSRRYKYLGLESTPASDHARNKDAKHLDDVLVPRRAAFTRSLVAKAGLHRLQPLSAVIAYKSYVLPIMLTDAALFSTTKTTGNNKYFNAHKADHIAFRHGLVAIAGYSSAASLPSLALEAVLGVRAPWTLVLLDKLRIVLSFLFRPPTHSLRLAAAAFSRRVVITGNRQLPAASIFTQLIRELQVYKDNPDAPQRLQQDFHYILKDLQTPPGDEQNTQCVWSRPEPRGTTGAANQARNNKRSMEYLAHNVNLIAHFHRKTVWSQQRSVLPIIHFLLPLSPGRPAQMMYGDRDDAFGRRLTSIGGVPALVHHRRYSDIRGEQRRCLLCSADDGLDVLHLLTQCTSPQVVQHRREGWNGVLVAAQEHLTPDQLQDATNDLNAALHGNKLAASLFFSFTVGLPFPHRPSSLPPLPSWTSFWTLPATGFVTPAERRHRQLRRAVLAATAPYLLCATDDLKTEAVRLSDAVRQRRGEQPFRTTAERQQQRQQRRRAAPAVNTITDYFTGSGRAGAAAGAGRRVTDAVPPSPTPSPVAPPSPPPQLPVDASGRVVDDAPLTPSPEPDADVPSSSSFPPSLPPPPSAPLRPRTSAAGTITAAFQAQRRRQAQRARAEPGAGAAAARGVGPPPPPPSSLTGTTAAAAAPLPSPHAAAPPGTLLAAFAVQRARQRLPSSSSSEDGGMVGLGGTEEEQDADPDYPLLHYSDEPASDWTEVSPLPPYPPPPVPEGGFVQPDDPQRCTAAAVTQAGPKTSKM